MVMGRIIVSPLSPGWSICAFGSTQPSGAGARIAADLRLAWLDGGARKQTEARAAFCRHRGHMTRSRRSSARALAQEILHRSIFQRVKGDDGETASGRKNGFRCDQA